MTKALWPAFSQKNLPLGQAEVPGSSDPSWPLQIFLSKSGKRYRISHLTIAVVVIDLDEGNSVTAVKTSEIRARIVQGSNLHTN